MKAIELYKKQDQVILLSAVNFSVLNEIVRFTQRENSKWSGDEEHYKEPDNNQYYQRETNINRVKGIKKHIEKCLFDQKNNSEVLFPSSMILGVDLDFDDLIFQDDVVEFKLPSQKESCLIVDGQHRMKAMSILYEELNKDISKNYERINIINQYKFNCTILINYDLWEQANIFASVNFNQKPVDRSLYYDIFGETPDHLQDKENSKLYIAHELGKYLNSSLKSPLNGFVKNFQSKQGFVSQAFLMQSLLSHLGPRGTWSEITEDYKEDGELFKKLPKIYVAYFTVLKNTLKEFWPKSMERKDATILSKTTGLGALIKLLGHIDTRLKLGLFPNQEKQNLLDLTLEELITLFENIFKVLRDKREGDSTVLKGEKYFGKESNYAGSGSLGLQSQLFKELAKEIGVPLKA